MTTKKIQKAVSWPSAYAERSDLQVYGSAGLGLFAMALRFGYDDLQTIGADAVVDGPDDRGCDVVYIDLEQNSAVIAQTYESKGNKISANAGKAASLRQAVSALVELPIGSVPDRLKTSAAALRSALNDGTISSVYVWFVHNCPSSQNVKDEMAAVEQTVGSIFKARFPNQIVNISAEELSSESLETLYTETSTPILVNDPIHFATDSGFSFEEGEWKCFVVPLKLQLLKDLYSKHSTNLFSANVRDFLGLKAYKLSNAQVSW